MIGLIAALLFLAPQTDAAAPEPACTAQTAIRTDLRAIAEHPERFAGRCVTVSGPASGIALYSGVEGIYLNQRKYYGGWRHRIGLYSPDNRIRRSAADRDSPAVLTVTGRVDTCERLSAAAHASAGPDSIVMMSGYCHYYSGAVVHADVYFEDSRARVERLYGERARKRYGELIAPPDDWPMLPQLQALADRFETALKAGDRRALAALHDLDPDDPGDDRAMLDYLLTDERSPFAEIRRAGQSQSALFIRHRQLSGDDYREASRHPSGVLCFCRTRDCSRSWPISASDASNAPDKPYACTMIEPQDWAKRKSRFNTLVDKAWLAEPAETAFHRS